MEKGDIGWKNEPLSVSSRSFLGSCSRLIFSRSVGECLSGEGVNRECTVQAGENADVWLFEKKGKWRGKKESVCVVVYKGV